MPVTMLHKCRGWFGMLLSSALEELNTTPRGKWPVLITVDEAGILPRQPRVQQAYAESRKRGVQLFCFFQQTSQALEIYGESGLNNFESGSEIIIHLPPRDLDTAKRISDRAGRGSIVLPQFSYSPDLRSGGMIENLSYGEHPKDVFTPQQTMSLGRHRAVLFTPGSSNALIVGRRPWFDISLPGYRRAEHAELRRRIAPDPYHRTKR
jgi:type IV secretory pathway TraG/TraD family ATPase VirD4